MLNIPFAFFKKYINQSKNENFVKSDRIEIEAIVTLMEVAGLSQKCVGGGVNE